MKHAENYGRLCAEFYDAEKPRPPAKELRFYSDLLRGADGPILEPMCGSGRFLLPLLGKRFDVVGFDNSVSMITQCQRRLADARMDVSRALLADFESFSPDRQFAQSFIPSGSFGLLNVRDAEQALLKHREWLQLDGYLHLEIWPTDVGDAGIRERSARVTEIDAYRCIGLVVELVASNDGAVHDVLCHYTDIVNGEVKSTETERYTIRHYELGELKSLASRCGFSWVACRENAFNDSRVVVTLGR